MADPDDKHTSEPLTPPGEASGLPAGSLDRLRDSNEHLTLAALRAQEQADDANVRYRDLVEGLDAIVWEATAKPWRFTFVSGRGAEMLGHSAKRWTESLDAWAAIIHPEDREATLASLQSHTAGSRNFRLQFRVVTSDGRTMWMAMVARHSRDADRLDQYRGFLVNIEDTVRAGTLEKLVTEQTRELLTQQDGLRSLATELNLAEHRVRSRMAAELHDHLAQMLALARLKLGQAHKIKAVPQACLDYIGQTEDVLAQCLTYTRTLVAELVPPVLQEFGLPAALNWLGRQMQRYDLAVDFQIPPAAPWSITEEQGVLLFQSVRELLINIGKHAQTTNATVRLEVRDDVLHLLVQDEGRGFDPSVTLRNEPGQASKFGLFSIRERMRAIGGAFDITAVRGQGARAMLTLPLRSKTSSPPTTGEGPGPEAPPAITSSLGRFQEVEPPAVVQVLLVDDHAVLRESLHSVVDSYEHFHVIAEAGDGLEAVEAVRRFRPDVVVMDIHMPRMNGIEATRLIKREFPNVGIVGLSVNDSVEMIELMSEAGISAYVTKESAVKTLCLAIEQAFAQGHQPAP